MLPILGRIPKKVYVAVSGGPDSMALLNFLQDGRRDITVLHYDHGTDHGREAKAFVTTYCNQKNLNIICESILDSKIPHKASPEKYWRDSRYSFFDKFKDFPVLMAHNLDDQVENWIFTAMHGNPMLIPPIRGNYLRPFIIATKTQILSYCLSRRVPYLHDPSNKDSKYMRSFIRNNMVSNALVVNPGIYKTIKKRVIEHEQNKRNK